MRKIIAIIFFILGLTSCLTTRVYYPYFRNGYENDIIVKIMYSDGHTFSSKYSYKDGFVTGTKGQVFDSIEIFDINNNPIAFYPKEYLDKEREKVAVEKELWVVYDGELALIPDEYRRGKKWQEYIKGLEEYKQELSSP